MTPGSLVRLIEPTEAGGDSFIGAPNGPAGKRAYGGLLAAQALAAACRSTASDRVPTAVHVQYVRGGDAGVPARYQVTRVHDGRTTSSRGVLCHQGDRLIVNATALFAVPATGPVHSHPTAIDDPDTLPRTGPIGPAPALPADEVDIRTHDEGWGTADFVRRLWWRVTVDVPDDPVLHACLAVYVTDVYGIDPVLAVHGHSMTDRSHHAATTDSSTWFHTDCRADRWNLLECRSPAAARGRGIMMAGLYDTAGVRVATMVHEGQAVTRMP
ncbi:MAG: thioesterase family protein [Mycobacterium sp.]|nr:thioesterase family protein [Mycobacterium sp.]